MTHHSFTQTRSQAHSSSIDTSQQVLSLDGHMSNRSVGAGDRDTGHQPVRGEGPTGDRCPAPADGRDEVGSYLWTGMVTTGRWGVGKKRGGKTGRRMERLKQQPFLVRVLIHSLSEDGRQKSERPVLPSTHSPLLYFRTRTRNPRQQPFCLQPQQTTRVHGCGLTSPRTILSNSTNARPLRTPVVGNFNSSPMY